MAILHRKKGLLCDKNLFADDTSLSLVVHDPVMAASNLQSDIEKKKRKLGEEMACEIQPVKIRIPDHIKEITETCSSRSKHVKCEYA